MKTRGTTFPVIGLFPSTVEQSLIPAGIRTRLYVSLADPDWKERIVSAVEHRDPKVARGEVTPFHINFYSAVAPFIHIVEVRPRAGSWAPFMAAVPFAENAAAQIDITYGPKGLVPSGHNLTSKHSGIYEDELGKWAFVAASNEATPTMSYYIKLRAKPLKIMFGSKHGDRWVQLIS